MPKVLQRLGRFADEGQPAARGQDDDQVTGPLDVGQAVGDAHHRLAGVGQGAEQVHHVAVGLLVQAGGDLVEEEQARLAQDLVGQAGALDLSAAEVADEGAAPLLSG